MGESVIWSMEEDAILRTHFVKKGATKLIRLLPSRTKSAIYTRADRIGLVQRKKKQPAYLRPDAGRRVCSDKELKLRIAKIPKDTRNFSAKHLGDPIPGRSALDMLNKE